MRFIATLILFISLNSILAQVNHYVVFYNVENLFDTEDDPNKNDAEFLPEGKKEWTKKRLREKSINLSKAILVSSNFEAPLLLGVCEIENNEVLKYLSKKTPLRKFKLEHIHYESKDQRGIDVALFYDAKRFEIIESKKVPIFFQDGRPYLTRDILYVKGLIQQDTVHIAVNHWPSRRGGSEKSEHKRKLVAKHLRTIIDSVGSDKNWLVMGDFNDEPHNKSLQTLVKKDFDNLMNVIEKGSYFYKSNWYKYDQLIISNAFKKSFKINQTDIIHRDWLMQHNEKKMTKFPFRSYRGPIYIGGFSDHLPIMMNFEKL